ncbi:UDP-N-acetylglucosamine 2-epimerase [Candidatus Omnitrophota bacterium]
MEFFKFMANALIILTDSGGIQEETTILKVPCLTLRENIERPVPCEMGSNRLVGTNPKNIIATYQKVMSMGLGCCKSHRCEMSVRLIGSQRFFWENRESLREPFFLKSSKSSY